MNYSNVKRAIMANIQSRDFTPIYISGEPGCGKTAVCVEVANDLGIPRKVTEDNCIFRPSFRDPVDLMGIPHVDSDGYTEWALNSFIRNVNSVAQQYGFALLVIDELAQAVPMMQNALAGLIHDRFIANNRLHDDVFVVATGNRAQDKAGSNRILTQLANRVEHLEMDVDIDSWCTYMAAQDYDPLLPAFIKFRPAALQDFDPDRFSNATMRSWEAAAKVDSDLPRDIYFAKIAGRVGEGWAAEYIGFRDVYHALPDRELIINNPKTAPIPAEPSARYATMALLQRIVDESNMAPLAQYVSRFSTEQAAPEFEVMFFKYLTDAKAELCETKEFMDWATTRGREVLL